MKAKSLSLTLLATDPEGTAVTYSVSGLPGNLQIDSVSGEISGYVLDGDAGTYTVGVSASDGVNSTAGSFNWTILDAPGGWVDFTDETSSRLSTTANSFEKDTAVGDLNNDGWDDIVIVHKTPFDIAGQQADTILMNG